MPPTVAIFRGAFPTDCRIPKFGMLGFLGGPSYARLLQLVINAPLRVRRESFAMYPVLPTELLLGAIELVCCFFTMLAAVVGCLLVRP